MSQPYIGEIRLFGGNFAPRGYAFCNGQLLPIAQYDALFALIGTTYGGDGQTTFALPNLQGRLPVHFGSGAGLSPYTLGQAGGAETVTLVTTQLPQHGHPPLAQSNPGGGSPSGGVWAAAGTAIYDTSGTPPDAPMRTDLVGTFGGSQPHDNIQPFLCINFIIALEGVFPSQA